MVIGNGMIATRFMDYQNDEERIIFASGVSNSKDTSQQHYQREFDLLKKIIQEFPDKSLVYFSTCSIEDKDSQNSPYIIHKKAIELYIRENVPEYYLLRISNVAGSSNNPYTLLNYFIFNILQNHPLIVWKNAYRNIIGIDDMYAIAQIILAEETFKNRITNIANPESYSVPYITRTIETFLGRKAISTEIERGENYQIDTATIGPVIQRLQIAFDNNYLTSLLKKYYHSR